MEKKLFTVTDLGGGDGGKGGVVHKICVEEGAHTIIKVGGAQAGHGVRTAHGQNFIFAQFGCGTFEGVRTHLSDLMVIEPYRLIREAENLHYKWQIPNPFDYLTIDENVLCVTPFHTFASRLKELHRGKNPKGTVGVGVGEAVCDAEQYPDLAIYGKDLSHAEILKKKLQKVQENMIVALAPITDSLLELPSEDKEIALEFARLLKDPEMVARTVAEFTALAAKATIVRSDYVENEIFKKEGVVVVESSHGILTDRYYGFHPHTTRLRTIPQKTIEFLERNKYDGEVYKLAVTRAYQIRHGAGPMVTESPMLKEQLLPGSNKDENRWQGKVRVGPLDMVMLQYALDVCGGAHFFDGFAVTWFDQIQKVGRWDICNSYNVTDQTFFEDACTVKVRHGQDDEQLKYQSALAKELFSCTPEVSSHLVAGKTQDELITLCDEVLQKKFGIGLRMISFGPTENEKFCL